MHFAVMVAIPANTPPESVNDLLSSILAPYGENEVHDCPRAEENDWEADCDVCARHWWDWWQVGGRWSGFFDAEYDPKKDPANQETCIYCLGTGTRPDGIERFGKKWAKWCNGCNGCLGTGIALKWSSQWVQVPSNRASSTSALARLNQLLEMKRTKAPGWMFPYKVVAGEVVITSDSGWDNRDATEGFDDRVIELVAKGAGIDWVMVDCHV